MACQYASGKIPDTLRNDEISLDILAVINVFYRHRKTFALILSAFLVIGTVYALRKPKIFMAGAQLYISKQHSASARSSVLGENLKGLAPIMGISIPAPDSDTSIEYVLTILKTKPFLMKVVEELRLVPFLVDTRQMDHVPDENEKLQLAYEKLSGAISISRDKVNPNLFWFGVSDISPLGSLYLTNKMINAININVRNDTVQRTLKEIALLDEQVEHTPVTDMKLILYSLIIEKKKQILLAEAKTEFVFRVIDPAEMPGKPLARRRGVTLVIFCLGGLVVATLAIFFIELRQKGYLHLIKSR